MGVDVRCNEAYAAKDAGPHKTQQSLFSVLIAEVGSKTFFQDTKHLMVRETDTFMTVTVKVMSCEVNTTGVTKDVLGGQRRPMVLTQRPTLRHN